MLYLLDANVIITAKDNYYAIDQVPEFWDWLVHQGASGTIKMPRETFEEVSAGGDKEDAFYNWRKDKATAAALLLEEEADPAKVARVVEQGYATDLTDAEILGMGADPFLVAYALDRADRTVVTTEASAPSKQRANRKLPDVCKQLGVRSISTFQMTRALAFRTNWKP